MTNTQVLATIYKRIMALSSIQVEKHVIGGLIQNPEVMSELESFVKDTDFTADPHTVIFSCIRSSFLKNEKLDKILIAQQIHNLGITFKDDINIFDYIGAISCAPITPQATIKAAQELVKLRVLRDVDKTCDEIQKHIHKSVNEELSKTITEADAIYGKNNNIIQYESVPEDLFSDMYNMIEETGNNPKDETGLITPYPEFNRMYGGFRGGNVYAIASRPAQGKTTWLNYTASETGRINDCPVLLLDTEMSTKEIKFRTAAGFSGVPLWYLETGNWRKNPEMVKKIRETLKGLTNKYKVYHYHVGNKPVDEVCSLIRRWYLSVVGRGNDCVVCYDYLKLTGEKLSNHWVEHQALGEKVDKFKRLSEELNYPFLTAIQLNRSGENTNRDSKDVADDGSAIAISDRLQWFTTYLGIFRRRTDDEIILDTMDSGTHKLIEIKGRFQGRDAAGHQDRIQRIFPDGTKKYVRNFINFDIQNFRVEEKGSLIDTIKRQQAIFKVKDEVGVKEDTL